MSEERFDAIIVGAGLAGCSAALVLARAGMEVLVIERGNWPGAKNVTGGRLYGHALEKLIPNFAEEAPVERLIVKERISLMTADSATTIEYSDEAMKGTAGASYSVLRSKFDKWLSEKAEEAGAMIVPGVLVDEVLREDGKVIGVRCGEETMLSDIVLLADGVNSLLAQQLGMKPELKPSQTAVGVKEVIGLDEKTICDRFGVLPGEGAAWMMAGFPSDGGIGGACLYTNKDSISLGVVLTTGEIGKSEYSVPQMLDRVKEHPMIRPLIEGGRLLEYGAHLVTEGGYDMVPTLTGDGVLLAGDAAAFVINLGYTVRGMDFAIESGRLAAEAILQAREKGSYSAANLACYRTMLENSFVLRDLKHHQKAPHFLENREIFNEIPAIAQEVMGGLFTVDGKPPVRLLKKVMPAVKRNGGIFRLGKVAMDALKAL